MMFKSMAYAQKKYIPNNIKRGIKRILLSIINSLSYLPNHRVRVKYRACHIIFVCKGNVCRSAFAEYYLRSLVSGEDLVMESCGLNVDQGVISPIEIIKVGREFGVELESHRSKGVAACDFQKADLIIPMEFSQYLQLTSLYPDSKKKIRLLRDFASWPDRLMCNIYDPFGLGEEEYRRCFSKIKKVLDGLAVYLSENNR